MGNVKERLRYLAGGVVFAVCIVLPVAVAKLFGRTVWIPRGTGR